MKKEIPTQLYVGLGILLIGGGLIGLEYFWVKIAPMHRYHVEQETLKKVPYHNDSLGIDMEVAAGIFGKVENFGGGVKISQSKFWGIGPSLTISSESNMDHSTEFSPQSLAKWEAAGSIEDIPNYHFDRTKLGDCDAVLIQESKGKAMWLTARILSADKIIVAACSTGSSDQAVLLEACDESLRSIKLKGPDSQPVLKDANPPVVTPPKVIQK